MKLLLLFMMMCWQMNVLGMYGPSFVKKKSDSKFLDYVKNLEARHGRDIQQKSDYTLRFLTLGLEYQPDDVPNIPLIFVEKSARLQDMISSGFLKKDEVIPISVVTLEGFKELLELIIFLDNEGSRAILNARDYSDIWVRATILSLLSEKSLQSLYALVKAIHYFDIRLFDEQDDEDNIFLHQACIQFAYKIKNIFFNQVKIEEKIEFIMVDDVATVAEKALTFEFGKDTSEIIAQYILAFNPSIIKQLIINSIEKTQQSQLITSNNEFLIISLIAPHISGLSAFMVEQRDKTKLFVYDPLAEIIREFDLDVIFERPDGGKAVGCAFSPDGKRLVCLGLPKEALHAYLYIINFEDNSVHKVELSQLQKFPFSVVFFDKHDLIISSENMLYQYNVKTNTYTNFLPLITNHFAQRTIFDIQPGDMPNSFIITSTDHGEKSYDLLYYNTLHMPNVKPLFQLTTIEILEERYGKEWLGIKDFSFDKVVKLQGRSDAIKILSNFYIYQVFLPGWFKGLYTLSVLDLIPRTLLAVINSYHAPFVNKEISYETALYLLTAYIQEKKGLSMGDLEILFKNVPNDIRTLTKVKSQNTPPVKDISIISVKLTTALTQKETEKVKRYRQQVIHKEVLDPITFIRKNPTNQEVVDRFKTLIKDFEYGSADYTALEELIKEYAAKNPADLVRPRGAGVFLEEEPEYISQQPTKQVVQEQPSQPSIQLPLQQQQQQVQPFGWREWFAQKFGAFRQGTIDFATNARQKVAALYASLYKPTIKQGLGIGAAVGATGIGAWLYQKYGKSMPSFGTK